MDNSSLKEDYMCLSHFSIGFFNLINTVMTL
jgi:hypothetical protein